VTISSVLYICTPALSISVSRSNFRFSIMAVWLDSDVANKTRQHQMSKRGGLRNHLRFSSTCQSE
jgi:hypothetical protein